MRIALYGMPTAGKTYILDRIDFLEVVSGSKLLRQYDSDFDKKDESGKEAARKAIAEMLTTKSDFIMDGHYAFGDELAFTDADGKLYDAFLYLYIAPDILEQRMAESNKNRKYLKYDIKRWQENEISSLRDFCHRNNKDFYVIDNPPSNIFDDVSEVVDFIRDVHSGYSCLSYARECAKRILSHTGAKTIMLLDGDKTLTMEDSSSATFGYGTHLFDGNFYTGYQAWKQHREFQEYNIPPITDIPVVLNEAVIQMIKKPAFILTSGHETIWKYIATELGIPFFGGVQMAAETKLFIVKAIQEAGRNVFAIGDSLNDYFMIKQADVGVLVRKCNGDLSRSLKCCDLEGIRIV